MKQLTKSFKDSFKKSPPSLSFQKFDRGVMFGSVAFIFVLLILFFNIFINWMMISWITKLEETQCKCSENWKRPLLKYWAYFSIGITILAVITGYDLTKIFSIFAFVNVIGTILYIYNLKSIGCECSESFKREFLYIYNWLKLGIAIAFFLFVIVVLIGAIMFISTRS